jgi:hypothetical protein
MAGTRHADRGQVVDVPALLQQWTEHGLLTADQAERILRAERIEGSAVPAPRDASEPARSPAGPARGHLLVEALAYLGGALALAAALILLQLAWADLPTGARLAVPTVAAAALVLAGSLLPLGSDELVRLRSVLWLLATGAWLGSLAVLGDQVLDAGGRDTALVMGFGGAALALPLYLSSRTELQQVSLFGSLVLVAVALAERGTWEPAVAAGVGVWLVSTVWFALAERGVLRPRWSARCTSAIGLVVGAAMTQSTAGGQVLALGTVAVLFVWGVRHDVLGLLAVAALGTLLVVPAAVTYVVPDRGPLVASLVLLLTGLALVAAAVATTRSRGTSRTTHSGGDGRPRCPVRPSVPLRRAR